MGNLYIFQEYVYILQEGFSLEIGNKEEKIRDMNQVIVYSRYICNEYPPSVGHTSSSPHLYYANLGNSSVSHIFCFYFSSHLGEDRIFRKKDELNSREKLLIEQIAAKVVIICSQRYVLL